MVESLRLQLAMKEQELAVHHQEQIEVVFASHHAHHRAMASSHDDGMRKRRSLSEVGMLRGPTPSMIRSAEKSRAHELEDASAEGMASKQDCLNDATSMAKGAKADVQVKAICAVWADDWRRHSLAVPQGLPRANCAAPNFNSTSSRRLKILEALKKTQPRRRLLKGDSLEKPQGQAQCHTQSALMGVQAPPTHVQHAFAANQPVVAKFAAKAMDLTANKEEANKPRRDVRGLVPSRSGHPGHQQASAGPTFRLRRSLDLGKTSTDPGGGHPVEAAAGTTLEQETDMYGHAHEVPTGSYEADDDATHVEHVLGNKSDTLEQLRREASFLKSHAESRSADGSRPSTASKANLVVKRKMKLLTMLEEKIAYYEAIAAGVEPILRMVLTDSKGVESALDRAEKAAGLKSLLQEITHNGNPVHDIVREDFNSFVNKFGLPEEHIRIQHAKTLMSTSVATIAAAANDIVEEEAKKCSDEQLGIFVDRMRGIETFLSVMQVPPTDAAFTSCVERREALQHRHSTLQDAAELDRGAGEGNPG